MQDSGILLGYPPGLLHQVQASQLSEGQFSEPPSVARVSNGQAEFWYFAGVCTWLVAPGPGIAAVWESVLQTAV